MQKLYILSFFLILSGALLGQQAIVISPNPTPSGTLSNLKIDSQGKLIKTVSSHYYNASDIDFLPSRTSSTLLNKFVRDDESAGTCYFETTATEEDWMLAPIDLPDGAELSRMKTFYFDNYTDENLIIQLIRRTKSASTVPSPEVILATSTSTNSFSRMLQTMQATISNIVIDNENYHYFIKVSIGEINIDVAYHWGGAALAIRTVEIKYNY